MIILIGGEKGGTGKTTIATNLATKHMLSGGDLLIVDTDKQGSANAWSSIRDENENVARIAVVQKFGPNIGKELKALSKKYKDIIIDSGGRDTVELRASMTVANKLYIPIQASQFDIWTLETMHELVTNIKSYNRKLQAFIIVNRAPTNPHITEVKDLQEVLEAFKNLHLCNAILGDRIAFRKAVKSGLSVIELPQQDPKATLEIEELYKEIFKK